ncbi:hypothetical protein QJS66_09435 [Kocuria rhizophila]|nr:hypothetical protein QJS66_09435 [Kocuria rhizophila]
MRSLGSGSGVWEPVAPGMKSGDTYKYRIQGADGAWRDKADPHGLGTDTASTASRVLSPTTSSAMPSGMAARAATDPHNAPMSVYEMHLGSWRMVSATWTSPGARGVPHVAGVTDVEFMPVAEHPFGGSWATRRRATTRRPRASAPRTSSATWWTSCTRPGSA